MHVGIKVFSLVLSCGFLYNWHVYRGKDDPLSGPDYMFRLIYSTLLCSNIWDYVNAIVFFDAAFTSVKLVRELHDERGIYAVGPINAGKGSGPNSWPLQTFNNSDTKFLERGWDRVAVSPLDRGGWLQVCNVTP